jgi:putative SOS response-associated peptidase YedK
MQYPPISDQGGLAMCGRYITADALLIGRFFRIDQVATEVSDRPRYNTAPTQQVPVIVRGNAGSNILMDARWGLIPQDWQEPSPPKENYFNARSESVAFKAPWSYVFDKYRCIMPAVGWYEWNEKELVPNRRGNQVRQPYLHRNPTCEVIAIAGIWSGWEVNEAHPYPSCALLTKGAAPSVSAIHHRMPVILEAHQYEAWLDPETDIAEIQEIIKGSMMDFQFFAVSTDVNEARNNFPELLEQLKPPGQLYSL